MRKSLEGSGTEPLIIACRTLFRTTSHIAVVAGLLVISGCTTASGPDVTVATYGITVASPLSQGANAISNETAPDQPAAAMVASTSAAPLPASPPVDASAFVPGAVPPSAVLPTSLAADTSIIPNAGAVANSGNYVTDGVERKIAEAAPAPLTPSDVAGQVPAPVEPESKPAKQVASLEVQTPDIQTAEAVSDPIVAPKSSRAVPEKKPTLFGSLFGNKPKKAQQSLTASPDQGEMQLASLETEPARQTESMNSLPGVNAKNLFALDPSGKGSGEEEFEEEPQVQLASAAGMARLDPNGLLKQTDRVEVACFKPELVSVLKKIEGHYGQKVVVTSGYRSPTGNRRAGGSRHSLHMSCSAADIQISGVGKWELAKYLRSMPGRGGVGTYCYTDSVHIDVGSERDWNWRCRRR
jgi:uncharacterized protein YcbK (DUF882 family)